MYDLAVAYRIYPGVSKPGRSLPFGDDKLVQAEVCLRSFKQSLGDLRVKVWALLDGCPDAYESMFRRYFCPEDLVVLRLDGVGNHATFGMQIDLLLQQNDAELVYFAEDDYFYLPNQFPKMTQFLQECANVDFVSPYDHADCYSLSLHDFAKWITVSQSHHWRTAASTCLTFLTKKETLRDCQDAFRSYCRDNRDASLWLSLTKKRVWNAPQILRYAMSSPFLLKIIARAWFFGWFQILFNKPRSLWIPVPALATHLDGSKLSPTIDWKELMDNEEKEIRLDQVRG